MAHEKVRDLSTKSAGLQTSGVIRTDELYTLSEIKLRLGVSNATLRTARRAGLRVYYKHRHAFIYGRDWIDYIVKSLERTSA